ncbi:retrovirus-related Pol polyprotein from transposon TNT 1-94 [Trichonephila clavipes]|nr:retrovirus-related Pol polyprotein from transposon TNT 1-94 [Trichonephila clavipes]
MNSKHQNEKNRETVADYIARARGFRLCHSPWTDVSPRELVYLTVRGLNGKFSKVRDILKNTKRKKHGRNITNFREEEATLNLPIKTRMDGIKLKHFILRTVIIETRTLQVQAKETIRLEMDTYLQLPIEKKKLCDNIWILIVVHPVILKNLCGSKNISPEVMDIYLADKKF